VLNELLGNKNQESEGCKKLENQWKMKERVKKGSFFSEK